MSDYNMVHKYGKSSRQGEKKISLSQQDLASCIQRDLME